MKNIYMKNKDDYFHDIANKLMVLKMVFYTKNDFDNEAFEAWKQASADLEKIFEELRNNLK